MINIKELLNDPELISNEFNSFVTNSYGNTKLSEDQINKMKEIFFSGYVTLMIHIEFFLLNGDGSEAALFIENRKKECLKYFKKILSNLAELN